MIEFKIPGEDLLVDPDLTVSAPDEENVELGAVVGIELARFGGANVAVDLSEAEAEELIFALRYYVDKAKKAKRERDLREAMKVSPFRPIPPSFSVEPFTLWNRSYL